MMIYLPLEGRTAVGGFTGEGCHLGGIIGIIGIPYLPS
jgi:tetrahydrodipicolinate N-succinyltransferase